jgi:hypothetical protein
MNLSEGALGIPRVSQDQRRMVFAPASCSRKIPMICSSVNFDLFMVRSFCWFPPGKLDRLE